MIFGSDIDHNTNVNEGYLMCEYDPETIISKDGTLDMEEPIRFFSYVPKYICKEAGWTDRPLLMDVELSPKELWEKYQSNKTDINEIAGREENHQLPKNIEDVFRIAYDVDSYMGLK